MKQTAILINLVILSLFLGACGPTTRERTLHTTLVAVDAAAAGFVNYDLVQQHAIVQIAMSYDDGRTKLAAYRDRREIVMKAFEAAYRALAAAVIINEERDLQSAVTAAMQLKLALEQFRKDNDR